MSVNKEENRHFTSPFQSIFKNYRFFTNYKPQISKSSGQNQFRNLKGSQSSSKQKTIGEKKIKPDFRNSQSRSHSREKMFSAMQSTQQNNFYHYRFTQGTNLVHQKKTSIDLDHSLRRNFNEGTNMTKQLKSNKPSRPYKKMENFMGILPRNHKFHSTVHPVQGSQNPRTNNHNTYAFSTMLLSDKSLLAPKR